jgi:phosphoglycerol transferase
MQDEYVYSMQSRKVPLTESEFPNFLYSWLYSSTNACGINFYSCNKNLNLVFFAGFVGLLFWLTFRFLNKWWALAIAMATALSPLSIFTSVFMPESMYFFFALASLAALWWASRSATLSHYALAGGLLGLTSLVKPHALFLIGSVVLYLIIIRWSHWKALVLQAGVYIASAIVIKLLVGILLAGPNGFTLFGRGYTNSVNNFTEDLTGAAAESLSASGPALSAATEPSLSFLAFVTESLVQFGWQSAALAMLALAPLLAVVAKLKSSTISGKPEDPLSQSRELQRLGLLLVLSLATMVAVIAAFAAMVTLAGDDHSNRILLRYYEFLVPALIVVAIAMVGEGDKGKVSWIRYAGAILVLALGAVGLSWTAPASEMIADSSFRFSFTGLAEWTPWFLALAAVAGLTAFVKGSIARFALGLIVLTSMAFTGHTGQDRLYNQAGFLSPIDSAGIFARDYLAQEEGSTIFYAGVNKQLTLASIFWVDKPGVQYGLFAPGQQVNAADLPEGTKWVVLVSGLDLAAEQLYQVTGQGFTVARVGAATEHRFDQNMLNSPLENVDGIVSASQQGAVNSSPEVTLRFREALAAQSKLSLSIVPSESAIGQVTTFTLGDSTLEVVFEQAGVLANLDLEFGNSASQTELVIGTPSAGSIKLVAAKLVP